MKNREKGGEWKKKRKNQERKKEPCSQGEGVGEGEGEAVEPKGQNNRITNKKSLNPKHIFSMLTKQQTKTKTTQHKLRPA